MRQHGPVRWLTLTSARIAYEDERAALGMDYAEAVLLIRRTMAHPNGHVIEVTEVKALADRYEIGYHRELADDAEADFTPHELSKSGIDLVIWTAVRLVATGSGFPYWFKGSLGSPRGLPPARLAVVAGVVERGGVAQVVPQMAMLWRSLGCGR